MSVDAVMESLPAPALTTSESSVPSLLVTLTCAGNPTTATEVPLPNTSIRSSPLVPVAITVSASASPVVPPNAPARLTFTWRDVGAAEITHRDRVRAAECVEVDTLDVVDVHRDRADVTGETQPLAVRREADVLADGSSR